MYISVDKYKVEMRDDTNGRVITCTYMPEKIVSAQVISNDQVVVTCEKTIFVLRRYPGSTSFAIYQRRRRN